jgi:hypothetical protein
MAVLPRMFGSVVSLTAVLDRPLEAVLARRARCVACRRAIRPWQRRMRVRGRPVHQQCPFGALSSPRSRVSMAGEAGPSLADVARLREIVDQAEAMGIASWRVLAALGHPAGLLDAPDREQIPAAASGART